MKVLNEETNDNELEVSVKVSKEEKVELMDYASNKNVVRYLVDQYYQSQSYRIAAQNQIRSLLQGMDTSDDEQPKFIEKELNNAIAQESLNKKYMDVITNGIPICRWMKSILGIGPVLSASIYSAFNIKAGNYATEFLSYAGLNDNNNPWLGTEKAKNMVKEAVEKRDKIFKSIESSLTEYHTRIPGNNVNKFLAALKKEAKNGIIEFTDIDKISEKITKTTPEVCVSNFFKGNKTDLDEYLQCSVHTNYAGSILYAYIANKTGRKVFNIEKGTINNNKKPTEKSYPKVSDLESYLAKPPYNTDLKKKMYLIGDMFIKQSSKEKSLYGKIYKERRLYETEINDNFGYKDQAKMILSEKNFDKSTEAYKWLIEGKLPPGHIVSRARRYATKLFISHVWEAMYYDEYRKTPPDVYVIAHMGHHDYIAPEVDYRPFIDGDK